jgi:phosphocarrier protein
MATEARVLEETIIVNNKLGLHARVATMVVQTMKDFQCRVTLMKDGVEADARSVLGLLLLAATQGSEITARADGPDSKEALLEIGRLLDHE